MKKTRLLAPIILIVFLMGIVGCATLQNLISGIDTPTKKFVMVQEEVNASLEKYKEYLNVQDAKTQAALHAKYDNLILALDAALDAWHEMVLGITLESDQIERFLKIKNQLILAGWNFFSKDKIENILDM